MTVVQQGHGLSLDDVVNALRVAVHDSVDLSYVIGRDGRFLMANPALCHSLSVDESVLIGQRYEKWATSKDSSLERDQFRSVIDGTASRHQRSGVRADGTEFVTDVSQSPLRIDGEVLAVYGTATDTSAARPRDGDILHSVELLRLAGRIARFGGWSVDFATHDVSLSDEARRILGIADDVADLTTAAWERHSDEGRVIVEAAQRACLDNGTPFDLESVMATTSGQPLTIRTVGEAEVLDSGEIIRAHGAIWDMSDIAAARQRERESEARLSATLRAISDGIVFVDHDDVITFLNPRAVEMVGLSEAALLGTSAWTLFPDAVAAGFHDSFNRARSSGNRDVHRALLAARNRWVETTSYPTVDGLAIYVRDVTEDERARWESRQSQAQLVQQGRLLDSARDAMIVRDLDNRVQYWNRAAADLYGWSADEVQGRWVGDLIYPDAAVLQRATDEVLRVGYFVEEVEQRTRDGRTILVDCRWQRIDDDLGNPVSIFAVNTDVTEARREQTDRLRAQRLESLGTLAGGIAHDLNNVLTPVLMSVQLLAHNERDSGRLELLSTMEAAVKHGADMIRQVLSFARGVEGQRIPVNTSTLLDELVTFARDLLATNVKLEVHRLESMPTIVGDPTQLMQVLVNLVTNARDAMDADGTLRIDTELITIDSEYYSVSHTVTPGLYLGISVDDSGHGMTDDVALRIFEPFFTTKAADRGTGLGLSSSLAIVRSHHGFMQVSSEVGRGTRFTVGLPVDAAAPATPSTPVPTLEPLPSGVNEVVLVVDDESTIRQLTRQTLEMHGYRTLGARNGQEAIDLIERDDIRVDLVFTDLMMPVMDGAATSAYLEEHYPHIPIILTSGLSGGSARHDVGMGVACFLPKPFTTAMLLIAVRDTLDPLRDAGEES